MKPLRILLVDDDALIGDLLAEMLEGMGHIICGIEATEAGAVQAALECKPELMIVDAHLGPGSGIAAVATIARVASIPHIFMSGDRLPATLGPAITLLKPFTARDLVGAIERATCAIHVNPA